VAFIKESIQVTDLTVTLKVGYIEMFIERGYINQIISNAGSTDPRRVTLVMSVFNKHLDQVQRYATHVGSGVPIVKHEKPELVITYKKPELCSICGHEPVSEFEPDVEIMHHPV